MEIKAREFTVALANYIAAIAPTLKRTAPGIELFTTATNEADAAQTYSCLRHFPGEAMSHLPRHNLSIQCKTYSTDLVAAAAQSQLIHSRLSNDKGPLIDQPLTGFMLQGIKNLRAPQHIISDQRGVEQYVFNFEVYYYLLP